MRHRQPRLLVIWGKYDPSFDISEPEAYRRDVPEAEVHVLDAGHVDPQLSRHISLRRHTALVSPQVFATVFPSTSE